MCEAAVASCRTGAQDMPYKYYDRVTEHWTLSRISFKKNGNHPLNIQSKTRIELNQFVERSTFLQLACILLRIIDHGTINTNTDIYTSTN